MAVPTLGGQKPTKSPQPNAPGQSSETSHPPQVDSFKVKGKMVKGELKDLTPLLKSISFLEVAPEKDRPVKLDGSEKGRLCR